MYTYQISPGQRVRLSDYAEQVDVRGREFLIVDRHPRHGFYWLQDAETGHVDTRWYGSPAEMTIIEDSPASHRPVVTRRDGSTALAFLHKGVWGAMDGPTSSTFQIVHIPTGAPIGREVPNRTVAKRVLAGLAASSAANAAEVTADNLPIIAAVYNETSNPAVDNSQAWALLYGKE